MPNWWDGVSGGECFTLLVGVSFNRDRPVIVQVHHGVSIVDGVGAFDRRLERQVVYAVNRGISPSMVVSLEYVMDIPGALQYFSNIRGVFDTVGIVLIVQILVDEHNGRAFPRSG